MYEKNAKINKKTYPERKGPDTPGNFGFKRAEKINRKII